MGSQENFSKINSNNKNLDLENSKSRFFNVADIFLSYLDYVNSYCRNKISGLFFKS